jgi:hypothetical protein
VDKDERVDEGVYDDELLERLVVLVVRALGVLERVGVVLAVRTVELVERDTDEVLRDADELDDRLRLLEELVEDSFSLIKLEALA